VGHLDAADESDGMLSVVGHKEEVATSFKESLGVFGSRRAVKERGRSNDGVAITGADESNLHDEGQSSIPAIRVRTAGARFPDHVRLTHDPRRVRVALKLTGTGGPTGTGRVEAVVGPSS
jgi:hypothetical protein